MMPRFRKLAICVVFCVQTVSGVNVVSIRLVGFYRGSGNQVKIIQQILPTLLTP